MIVYREAPTGQRSGAWGLHTLYALSNRLCAHYHTVELTKPNGSVRRLTVPDEALKGVQRSIARNLLACRGALLCPQPTTGWGLCATPPPTWERSAFIYSIFDSVNYSAVKDAVFPAEVSPSRCGFC